MDHPPEHTSLWKNHLSRRDDDPHSQARERLRSELTSMRSKTNQLVSRIQADCPGITVHDATHLDALWEIADILTNDQFELNPAEVFVFGGAVLLHDAGMAAAAYPHGIRETLQWRDAVASLARNQDLELPDGFESTQVPEALAVAAQFLALRDLHADQALFLATREWRLSNSGVVHLLESGDLRSAYGELIGRIASSHHWDVWDLPSLGSTVGVPPGFPTDWIVDPVKVACLLRCCDAAHIDAERAPRFAMALTNPSGASLHHWTFQNKLNRPHVSAGFLRFTSGTDFDSSEAQAWWLAYDTACMIDREVSESNNLLAHRNLPSLSASGVYGAHIPSIFASTVRPKNWEPIDVDLKASDPHRIARILGGKQLYGRDQMVAIRELLQNSADAIRNLRALLNKGPDLGTIRIQCGIVSDENGRKIKFTIDDDGTGMSKTVLAGPLIDFGKSLFASDILRSEHPGLSAKNVKRIGRFGIGFFAVFTLGNKVSVASKRYDKGADEIRVVDFGGLDSRPIMRIGTDDDLPHGVHTRVTLFTSSDPQSEAHVEDPEDFLQRLSNTVKRLAAGLDIRVEFTAPTPELSFIHDVAWNDGDPDKFLRELLSEGNAESMHAAIKVNAERLDTITHNGVVLGRAAVFITPTVPTNTYASFRRGFSFVSVGGICSRINPENGLLLDDDSIKFAEQARKGTRRTQQNGVQFIGVMEGVPSGVTRAESELTVPREALLSWMRKQKDGIVKLNLPYRNQIVKAFQFWFSGVEPTGLLIGIAAGKLVTFEEFREFVRNCESFRIITEYRSSEDRRGAMKIRSITEVSGDLVLGNTDKDVICYYSGSSYDSLWAAEQLDDEPFGRISFDQLAMDWQTAKILRFAAEIWECEPILEFVREPFQESYTGNLWGEFLKVSRSGA